MTNRTSTLTVRLKDGVSGPAGKAAQSIRSLDRAAKNAKGGTQALAASSRSLAVAGSALEGAGLAMALRGGGMAAGAFGVGLALHKAGKEALSFERIMYKVEKATDTSGDGAKKFADDLIRISKQTGKTKEELGEMMAAAGFAGRPVQELTRFTEYAAKATSAWEMKSEETGQALAEIGNIYGANQQRIEEIGDAINTAADSSASRESDLLEFIRRAGPSGKIAGIAAEQVLAFGAAMKEIGTPTEVAATGFEALMNVMRLGAEFSDKAGDGLRMLGVSSDKMRRQFVAKPLEATLGLLNKISNVSDPMKRAEILTNIFGKEYQDDIQKLLNQLPRLNTLLGVMGNKANYLGSVQKGFELWQEKDFAKIERAERAWDSLMTRLGRPIKLGLGAGAERAHAALDRLEVRYDEFVQSFERGETVFNRIEDAARGHNARAIAEQELIPGNSAREYDVRLREMIDAEKKRILDERQARGASAANAAVSESVGSGSFWDRHNPAKIGAQRRVDRILAENAETVAASISRQAEEIFREVHRYPWAGDDSEAREQRTVAPQIAPLPPSRPVVPSAPGLYDFAGRRPLKADEVPHLPYDRFAPVDPTPSMLKTAPLAPAVDTSELEAAKQKAAETGAAITTALNVTASPTVDLASLREADSLLDSLIGKLARLRGEAGSAARAVSRINVPAQSPASAPASAPDTSRELGRQYEARRRGSFADYEHS